jgi:hypothetical protein
LFRDHKKRESDFILDEYLWENEREKIFQEMRRTARD